VIDPNFDSGSLRLPRRNPSLIQRVIDRIAGTEPDFVPQATPEASTQTGIVVDAAFAPTGTQYGGSSRRMDICNDAEEMDNLSEEVSVALDTIADNVCTSEDGVQMSFQATSKDPKVQAILDETNARADLHQKVKPLVRNGVKYGDAFIEICVDDAMQLADAKQLPPKTMRRNTDIFGNLIPGEPRYSRDGKCLNQVGECAYEQVDPADADKVLAAFHPLQIVHLRMNWDGFSAYGRSHLRVTRHSWKKLRAIEESMIVGRLTRDYMKLIFYIDTTGLSQEEARKTIREFKNSVTTRGRIDRKGEAPMSVMTDFFMNNSYVRVNGQAMENRSRIDVLDPKNEGLHNIDDVEYHHRKLISTLRVPPAHMGFERDLNAKATLTQQDVQYVRWLRSIQQLVGQALEQIYDTALALNGIDPEEAEYRIAWPMLKATDELAAAQAYFNRAQGNAIYLGGSQQNSVPVVDAQWVQDSDLDMTVEEKEDLNKRLLEAQAVQEQKAQEQAAQAHSQALELTKAKTASGVPPEENNRQPSDKPVVNVASKGRAVSAEARMLYAGIIADRTEQLLEPEVRQLHRDQVLSFEAAQALTDRALTIVADSTED
jgi:hypothetical protein